MASYGDLTFVTTSRTSTVKGMEWPWSITNTGGMCSSNYNEVSVRQGLIQLLLTQRGERPMRLDYGTELRASVFAPLDSQTIAVLKESILTAINRYEPRVVVRTFDITPKSDNSEVDISLVFSMKENVFTTEGISLTVNTQGIKING